MFKGGWAKSFMWGYGQDEFWIAIVYTDLTSHTILTNSPYVIIFHG